MIFLEFSCSPRKVPKNRFEKLSGAAYTFPVPLIDSRCRWKLNFGLTQPFWPCCTVPFISQESTLEFPFCSFLDWLMLFDGLEKINSNLRQLGIDYITEICRLPVRPKRSRSSWWRGRPSWWSRCRTGAACTRQWPKPNNIQWSKQCFGSGSRWICIFLGRRIRDHR